MGEKSTASRERDHKDTFADFDGEVREAHKRSVYVPGNAYSERQKGTSVGVRRIFKFSLKGRSQGYPETRKNLGRNALPP